MPLLDYKPPTRTIEFPGGSFDVRPISLMDVSVIVEAHLEVVESIYNKLQARAVDMEDIDAKVVGDVVMDIIRESPTLIGHIIAISSDERDDLGRVPMSLATKLPVNLQIEALQAIGQLTFTDMASVKKFGADVMSLIRGILPTPQSRTSARKRAA